MFHSWLLIYSTQERRPLALFAWMAMCLVMVVSSFAGLTGAAMALARKEETLWGYRTWRMLALCLYEGGEIITQLLTRLVVVVGGGCVESIWVQNN